jgi:hyperosmotically inducible protein
MTVPIAATCVLFGALLGAPMVAAAQDPDRSHPAEFVTDSVITTIIKAKLAAEHPESLARIHVDTDKDGVVWLSGSARSQTAAAKALSIARTTEHVRTVHTEIKILREPDDRGMRGAVGLSLVLALLGGANVAPR